MLDQDRLQELLDYDPASGTFTWRVSRGRVRAGRTAGCLCPRGYRYIHVAGTQHLAARLAFLDMTGDWPPHEINRIDGNPSNDAWSNLRPATRIQVIANSRGQRSNRTGLKGVTRHGQRYAARVCIAGQKRHLGTFDTPRQAAAAHAKAVTAAYGFFARTS